MGLIDGIRYAFGNNCQQLIKYQARIFDFKGLGASAPALNISLAEIRIGVAKLELATSVAKNLDMYQFLMCQLSRELGKKSPALLEKLIKARAVALGELTSFSNTLAAYKADPRGQRMNLDRAVKEMQSFMREVRNEIFKPSIVRDEGLQIQESAPDRLVKQQIEKIIRPPRRDLGKGAAIRSWQSLPSERKRVRLSTEERRAKVWSGAIRFAGLEEAELDKLAKELARSQSPG